MTDQLRDGISTAALCLMLLVTATAARAAADGRQLYRRECAPCHGANGHGDGPDAVLFASPPPDLHTALASLPADDVVRHVLDGRARSLALDAAALRARAVDVESLVAYLRRLPTVDWRTADPGATIYLARCEPCHGMGTGASAPLPPGIRPPRDLADPTFQASTSAADVVTAVRRGHAGMPALTPRLSEAQAVQVAAFVQLLSPGFTIYSQYCATCHGEHGVGAGSFAESYAAPTVVFDRAYFARQDPEALRGKVWHMLETHQPSMPHFRGRLSEAEARAIVAYLKARPQ